MKPGRNAVLNSMFSFSWARFFDRRVGDRRGSTPQPHPIFSSAISKLPPSTRWSVAANAEFRTAGTGDLRGILHHDGAILRFTTWGGVERFVGAPMEFQWERLADGTFHIIDRGEHRWFVGLRPLSDMVPEPPTHATTGDRLDEELEVWMRSWAPEPSAPLASPV